jgi:hypothetical protein
MTAAELEYIRRAEVRQAKARAKAKARSRARLARAGIVSRDDDDERQDRLDPVVRQRREDAKARRAIAKIREKAVAWRRARDLARLKAVV